MKFSLTDIVKPKWSASRLVDIENTTFLIEKRFSKFITHVDLAKLCFSFDTLDLLFNTCQQIKSLVINFKYLQIKGPNKYLVDNCIHTWPMNKLEKLYLKNVCDMKTRRLRSTNHDDLSTYDIIEMQIIKLIRILFRRNSNSLRVLGLKCVDPNIISSCIHDMSNLEILLLNNINDTDSVLQELAYVCSNLKCLELTKCREFKGDGLQEIIDQCNQLETLQLGKHIYPTISELNEINWSNLKYQLKDLSITTKFQSTSLNYSSVSSSSASSSSSSGKSVTSLSSYCSSSSSNSNSLISNSSVDSIDLYSSTIFNYLNDHNELRYLALEDFTLKFPCDDRHENENLNDQTNKKKKNYNHDLSNNDENDYNNSSTNKRFKTNQSKPIDIMKNNNHKNNLILKSDEEINLKINNNEDEKCLKYLYLRNIRNIKVLTSYQSCNLKSFLQMQYNLHTLDLIGLYLSSKFLCSILSNLNNLRIFNFGHGKSYKKQSTTPTLRYLNSQFKKSPIAVDLNTNQDHELIDVDAINNELAQNCPYLLELGIFYRQSELKFKRDAKIECKNEALINLLQSCVYMREISYLKSFKIQDDDDDDILSIQQEFLITDDDEENESSNDDLISKVKRERTKKNTETTTTNRKRKKKNYFHFIRYAIENASIKSNHVNMKPCYGYDITPSSGHLLDRSNNGFIQTSLPPIRAPQNDFHFKLLTD